MTEDQAVQVLESKSARPNINIKYFSYDALEKPRNCRINLFMRCICQAALWEIMNEAAVWHTKKKAPTAWFRPRKWLK